MALTSAGARGLSTSGDGLEIGLFLTLGTSAAEAVAAWHEANKLHGRICPETFHVDAAGTVLLDEPDETSPPLLAYLAPEQTGRLSRAEDARTDLYSLGVVLYELATGCPPFHGEDALELVHGHLARPPRRPSEVVGALAGTVEQILLRLLAKLPEERYQTASGVAADLERCRVSLRATGRIAAFKIGLRDQPDRLQVSQRLHGRKSELERLAGAVDAVVVEGRPRLICLAGEPGVGKSAMMSALGEFVAVAGGRLLAGEFAAGNQNVPHATFAEVTDQLVGQLLAESDERLAAWRLKLSAALGDDARVLVDLAPSWSLVLGDLPAVAELPAAETRQRVHRSVRRLIEAVTEPQHPLVLAFDDLQWADNASLELISQLLRHPDSRRLLVVGSYRSNEVGPDHPLTAIIAELREHGVAETVTLRPLSRTAIAAILNDTIHASRKQTLQLAEVVTSKTGGNPLFATQFLHSLNELGLLIFEQAGAGWVWDLDRVRHVPATDNVVDLVTARMSRLGPRLRRLLEAAALLGVSFDVGTVSAASGRDPNAVAEDLVQLLRTGLIVAVGGGLHVARSLTAEYRWSHDRVRQAARRPDRT